QLGSGLLNSQLDNVPQDTIDIPNESVCNDSLIVDIFDRTPQEMEQRVILSPKNIDSFAINENILRNIPGETKTYSSSDSASSDDQAEAQNYPLEFIISLTPSGMPPHRLNLKIGAIVMLLRNLSISQGLCNATRMKILQMHQNSIEATLISGSHMGSTVLIPRIKLTPSDTNLPFTLHRTQFPLKLSYSMTINKAQGQTFDKVGIYLQQPVFSHGQLYVAFSRSRAQQNVKVKVAHDDGSKHQ
ncbi:DNA helicase Pif1-like, partial [Trinorchestia longiramus]